MKKKPRVAGSGAAKARKGAAAPRKGRPSRDQVASASSASRDARGTVRRLRAELALAKARIGELEASADRDFLLDVLNRRGFERELDRSIAYIQRYHTNAALIVLDVDRLKPVNDTFGHAAGDQVLKAVVATLRSQVRASDVIGRLGGDEFAVLLWHLSETDAKAKASALEQAIDRLNFSFGDHTITAGASVGVAVLGPSADAGRALEEADSAMYVRKAQRRHEAVD